MDPDDAATHAEEGGFRLLAEQALTSLALVRLNAGSPGAAESLAVRAIAGFRATGHRLGEAYAFVVLGQARASLTGPAAARECRHTAEEIRAAAGERPVLAAVRTRPAR
ncbi:hypothetical protein [Amycolatopsis sp. NPDC051128]|uniref:hypothetical protein n=1 Tax=Amycolatopsis sp. NPDC051128 TaxID=3155412 RepID=UPI00342FBC78